MRWVCLHGLVLRHPFPWAGWREHAGYSSDLGVSMDPVVGIRFLRPSSMWHTIAWLDSLDNCAPLFYRFWLRCLGGLCVLFTLLVCLQACHIVYSVFVMQLFHTFRPSLMITSLVYIVGWFGSWVVLFFRVMLPSSFAVISPRIDPRLCPCMGPFFLTPCFFLIALAIMLVVFGVVRLCVGSWYLFPPLDLGGVLLDFRLVLFGLFSPTRWPMWCAHLGSLLLLNTWDTWVLAR